MSNFTQIELVRDRRDYNAFRVEAIDLDGGIEVAIFSGPNALVRAVNYTNKYYGKFADPELLIT